MRRIPVRTTRSLIDKKPVRATQPLMSRRLVRASTDPYPTHTQGTRGPPPRGRRGTRMPQAGTGATERQKPQPGWGRGFLGQRWHALWLSQPSGDKAANIVLSESLLSKKCFRNSLNGRPILGDPGADPS